MRSSSGSSTASPPRCAPPAPPAGRPPPRRVCRTVVLRLRFQDFTRATRSHTLPHATQQTEPILATARSLLATVMPTIERQGLTLLGIALTNLEDASDVQLVFAFERRHAIDEALDSVRDRF